MDRLRSRYSGDRAPITLGTLWGVAASPKKEVEISFCSVLRRLFKFDLDKMDNNRVRLKFR